MYLSIDYGRKRIGLAVGSLYPRGIGTLRNPGSFQVLVNKIKQYCHDYEVDAIVMGTATRSDGKPGELTTETHELGKRLALATDLAVHYEEEAFTSVEAEDELRSRGVDVRDNKELIDELAAILILEQFIDKVNR